jgi:hypothetical protein
MAAPMAMVMLTRVKPEVRRRSEVELEAAAHRRLDRWSLSHAIGLFLAVAGFVAAAGPLSDNSFLTHLATGRLILDSGQVPATDPYSSLSAGQPWTVQSWLPSVLYALLERTAGLGAIRVFNGALGACIAVGLWRLTRPARLVVPRLALAVVPVVIGYHLWSPRPLLVALATLVAVLHVVQLGWPVRWLVPIMWIWVNSHGSWPLAIALLLAVTVGQWADDRTTWPTSLPALGWASLGSLLGAVGPVGPAVLTFPLAAVARREAFAGVVEWQAPAFRSFAEWAFLALLPMLVLAARRGAGFQLLLPACGFMIVGMTAVRNLSAASLVIVAMSAPAMADLFGSDDGSTQTGVSRIVGRAMAAALGIITVVVLLRPAMPLDPYPVDEIDLLEDRGLLSDPATVFVHREAVGNYLTLRFGDRANVFMDDRFDFHPIDLVADHLDLLEGGEYRQILDRRRADLVLWESDRPLSQWLVEAPEWQVVTADDDWTIACRVDGRAASRC